MRSSNDLKYSIAYSNCFLLCKPAYSFDNPSSIKSFVRASFLYKKRAGFSVEEIHSDLEQNKREEVLSAFINGRLKILVATDILSRGIDIDNIDLVINYEVPNDGEDYVHRIGRTARAQSDGTAYTLVNEKEQGKFLAIEQLLGYAVPKSKVPDSFGETPAYDPSARKSGFKRKFKQRR